jgi:hypothetical protein
MAAEQGGGGGLGRGVTFRPNKLFEGKNSPLPGMAQEGKKGKTKYFFGPHAKSQSNFLTRFHYAPWTKKSFMTSKK